VARREIEVMLYSPACFPKEHVPASFKGARRGTDHYMKLRLLYHGHCFDGVASAAVFTRFYRTAVNADADVQYAGLLHRPGSLFDEAMFDGDENAIVDFKYSTSDKLTWWFDHHQSAFLTPEDEAHFKRERSDKKFLTLPVSVDEMRDLGKSVAAEHLRVS
jgi:hypothetical protein